MRFNLIKLAAGCVLITGCQQVKNSSAPKAAPQAAPAHSAPPQAGHRTPPPSGPVYHQPGPQPGPHYQAPPPNYGTSQPPMPAVPPPTEGEPRPYYPPPRPPNGGPVIVHQPPAYNPPQERYNPPPPRPVMPASPAPEVTQPPPTVYNPPPTTSVPNPAPNSSPTVYTEPRVNPGASPNLQPATPLPTLVSVPDIKAPPVTPTAQPGGRTTVIQQQLLPPSIREDFSRTPVPLRPPSLTPVPQGPVSSTKRTERGEIVDAPPQVRQQTQTQVEAPRPRSLFIRSTPEPKDRDTQNPNPVDLSPRECPLVRLDSKMETAKLDILFVVDTSASLHGGIHKSTGGELGQLARDIVHFAEKLDPKIDYNIGMILGHGPGANNIHHGQLFKTRDPDDTAVITLAKMKEGCRGSETEIRKCAGQKVGEILNRKMLKLPLDHTEAQGEALMLSLHTFLTKSNKSEMQKLGMLRDDAKLEVVMISDEQDVCYDYASSTEKPVSVVRRNPKTKLLEAKGPDIHEKKAFDTVCSNAVNGQRLTPTHVWEELLKLKGGERKNLILSALVYVNNDGLRDDYGAALNEEDENEMGHGYIELVTTLAGSPLMNMASVVGKPPFHQGQRVSFADQLSKLGEFTDFQMHYNNIFTCELQGFDDLSTNASLVTAYIVERDSKNLRQPIAIFSGGCQMICPQGASTCAEEAKMCSNEADGPLTTNVEYDSRGNTRLSVNLSYKKLSQLLNEKKLTQGDVRITVTPRLYNQ